MGINDSDFIFSAYKPGDEAKIVRLLDNVFHPWPLVDIKCPLEDYWRWKFLNSPENMRAQTMDLFPIAIVKYKGEVVGVGQGILLKIKIGDNTYLSLKGCEAAVDVNFRGMKLYSKITDVNRKTTETLGCSFNYFLSENPVFVNNKNSFKAYPFPHSLLSLLKVNNIAQHIEVILNEKSPWEKFYIKMGYYLLNVLNTFKNVKINTSNLKEIKVEEISTFSDEFDVFYDKIKNNYDFIVELNKDYLNWRYCDKKSCGYKIWMAKKENYVVGFMVIRINNMNINYPVGYIMEVLALNGMDYVVDNLIKIAVKYFDDNNVNVMHAQIIRNHSYEKLFNKYGFLNSRVTNHLTYTLKDNKISEVLKNILPDKIHYMYGNGDTI